MTNITQYNELGYNQSKGLFTGSLPYFANVNLTKRYYYKVYSQSGTYIGTWSNDVISDPTFRTVLNGGSGELVVQLARRYDNFGEGNDVALMNKVELWVGDKDNISNNRSFSQWDMMIWDYSTWDNPVRSYIKIYTGYISAYSPIIDDEKQYINVTLLGYATEGSYRIIKNTSGYTNFTLSSMDPSLMMKTIIDYYHIDGGKNLTYTGSSIANTGTTASYTFNEMTLQECINKIVEMTPSGWYWFIDANGIVNLKQINSIADHQITIGKDIGYLESNRRAENIVNSVFIVGGGSPTLYNRYDRTASINTYGKFEKKIQDGNVTDNATADLMAKRYLDTYQQPETRAVIHVIDNTGPSSGGQNIENYQVGDTIQIKNLNYGAKGVSLWDKFQWDSDVWDNTFSYTLASILTIVSITYNKTYLEIEVSTRLPEVTKRVEDVNKNVDQMFQEGIPTSPSVRTV